MRNFPLHIQPAGSKSCGATCLQMICDFYGKTYSSGYLAELTSTSREGTNFLALSQAAEKLGFRPLGIKIPKNKLTKGISLPCIAHVNNNHFVVVYKITGDLIHLADPQQGLIELKKEEFFQLWLGEDNEQGTLLLLDPSEVFYSQVSMEDKPDVKMSSGLPRFLYSHIRNYKFLLFQIILGLLFGSMLQLLIPFITQNIVDAGVKNKDTSLIYLLLIAQLFIFLGRTTVDIIRNWLIVYLSAHINMSMVADLYTKLIKLPVSYFDTKKAGEVLQRIFDSQRIEQFLTGNSLRTIFSVFNLLIFGAVLAWYNLSIFGIFLAGSAIYFMWVALFLKKRAAIDQKFSRLQTQNHNMIIEMVNGIQEIKLHNAEQKIRWQWQQVQGHIQSMRFKHLGLSQLQNSGAATINELKNILITFLAATLVIRGEISLGMMLSISYINGQLNQPVMEMIGFMQVYQDAKLSLQRLSEVQNQKNEEQDSDTTVYNFGSDAGISFKNVSFKYDTASSKHTVHKINLEIPANKITAIVGASGSGKTTLIKLLLKFHEPASGAIYLGNTDFNTLSASAWRQKCGTVIQDGYLFSDTIAANIALGKNKIDFARMQYAAQTANIREFIESLPKGYNTKTGPEGTGLSAGQKQRILIARAIYKNPDYLFFDEVTSSLDSENEKIIMENLNEFFKGRTVVIIAHRLSTVKNADQIIMLDHGRITEQGSHKELTQMKGNYFEFVRNQLEISG